MHINAVSFDDQRRHRSHDREKAITLQFKQVLSDFELAGCGLLGDEGEVLVSAERESGTLAQAVSGSAVRRRPEASVENVTMREFWAGGARYTMVVLGADVEMNEVALYRAILGVRRIVKHS